MEQFQISKIAGPMPPVLVGKLIDPSPQLNPRGPLESLLKVLLLVVLYNIQFANLSAVV